MRLTRRIFLGTLAALLGARGALASPLASPTPLRPVMTLAIAGTRHHRYAEAASALAVGERLVLRREPGNRFDANAVAIETAGGLRLGYVPRHAATGLAPRLDAGEAIAAEITGFLPVPGRGERFAIPEGLVRTWCEPGEPVVTLLA